MSSASPHKILIPEPDAGGALQFTIQPAQVYVLGFAPETSTIEQDGQDVRVLCENGGRIVLYGFFSAISQADITLELKDGTLISGQDLAEVLAMSLKDFKTQGQPDQPDLNVANAAGAATQEQAPLLRLEDVLETPSPAFFEDTASKTAAAVNSVGIVPASSVASDDIHTAMLLSLQRMDM